MIDMDTIDLSNLNRFELHCAPLPVPEPPPQLPPLHTTNVVCQRHHHNFHCYISTVLAYVPPTPLSGTPPMLLATMRSLLLPRAPNTEHGHDCRIQSSLSPRLPFLLSVLFVDACLLCHDNRRHAGSFCSAFPTSASQRQRSLQRSSTAVSRGAQSHLTSVPSRTSLWGSTSSSLSSSVDLTRSRQDDG